MRPPESCLVVLSGVQSATILPHRGRGVSRFRPSLAFPPAPVERRSHRRAWNVQSPAGLEPRASQQVRGSVCRDCGMAGGQRRGCHGAGGFEQ
jgi:hypothetical protein